MKKLYMKINQELTIKITIYGGNSKYSLPPNFPKTKKTVTKTNIKICNAICNFASFSE